MREEALKLEIESKNQDLEMNKSETKSLMNKLNSINRLYTNLQMKFEDAKEVIIQLQENQSEKELEMELVRNHLISVESSYTELQAKFEDLKEYLIGHQQNISEKEYEFDKMKIQIDCQQQEIEKLGKELKIKCDQLNEMQISREISNAGINNQLQELVLFKEKVMYWENLMLHLREEVSERSEEAEHWIAVSNKQKENLASLIEENQVLKTENDEHENEKVKLIFELETIRKELCELTEELLKNEQLIYQLNQEKNILQEKEECIDICSLKIAQMNNFLADRDETINILVNQLKTSTMLMLDDIDYDEGENKFCPTLRVGNMKMSGITREAAYKMKLWQSLEINRRLITMVDSLQHVNYTLREEKAKRQNFEDKLSLQYEGENGQCCREVFPS